MGEFSDDQWAVILGGSSGFGLATARTLAEKGMSVCVVHRDRRAALRQIEPEFEGIRAAGAKLITFNVDALDAGKRASVLDELASEMGAGRVRVLLHSIAFGNLKLLVPEAPRTGERGDPVGEVASRLGVDAGKLREAVDELFAGGSDPTHTLASPPAYSDRHFLDEDDFARTIHSMGTSLLWMVRAKSSSSRKCLSE